MIDEDDTVDAPPVASAPLVSPSAAPASLPAGARLGRYQVIRRLQRGGMAELYLARHLAEGGYEKIVAVKRVLPHLAEDETFVRMFLNEARLAAALTHGNIAQVLDFGSEGDEHYLVLEYVHGCSLHELLRASGKHGGVPLGCALTVVHEVAAALHYAHDKAGPDGRPLGLVHRDVSPSNVLVSYDGEVKLVDFGIAKATAHTRVTRSGTIKGKLAYMAPEQVRGEAIDRRADVFSLAVVAYELCTGRRCFVAPGEFALINRVAAGRYEAPSSVRPGFPAALEAIIARGLSVAVDDRFESARALQLAIEGFAEGHGQRLSKVALSEMMHGLFGHVAYPTSDALPTLVPVVIAAQEIVEPTRVRSRGRTTAMLAGGALVVGLGLGIGLPRLLADDAGEIEAAPNEVAPGVIPTAVITPTPADVVPTPAAPIAPAPAADTPPAPVDDEPVVIPDETPAPAGRRRPPRTKPRKPAPTSSAPPGGHEYLPPSRRPG